VWIGAAVLAPVLLFPFLLQPLAGILLAGAAIAILGAWYSPAIPLAMAGLPTVLFAIVGPNPLPSGGVTAIFSIWIGLGLAFAVMRRRGVPPPRVALSAPVVLTVLLAVLMLIRLPSEVLTTYGAAKLQLFLVANLVLLVGGVFVGWRHQQVDLFLALTMAVALAGALVLLAKFVGGNAATVLPDRFAVSAEDDPIALSRDSAYGVLISVYLIVAARNASVRLWAMAALPVLTVSLIAGGSRGPIVGLAVGLVVFAALASATAATRRRLLLVGLAAVAAIVVVPQVLPGATISRSFSFLTDSGIDVSSNGRLELWDQALQTIAANPLAGIGTGGFARLQPILLYPHNLLLETWVELGILGLVFTVLFAADVIRRLASAWSAVQGRARVTVAAVLSLLLAALVNAMFSGAIVNNSTMWLWAGVGIGLAASLRREQAGTAERG
jgi:O-antigen ligase